VQLTGSLDGLTENQLEALLAPESAGEATVAPEKPPSEGRVRATLFFLYYSTDLPTHTRALLFLTPPYPRSYDPLL